MADSNTTVSVITLNVSGLNTQSKWQELSKWLKRQDSIIFCQQETYFKYKQWKDLWLSGALELREGGLNRWRAVDFWGC